MISNVYSIHTGKPVELRDYPGYATKALDKDQTHKNTFDTVKLPPVECIEPKHGLPCGKCGGITRVLINGNCFTCDQKLCKEARKKKKSSLNSYLSDI